MLSAWAAAAVLAFSTPAGVAKTPFVVAADDGVELFAVEYRLAEEGQRRTVIVTGDGWESSETETVDELAQALFLRGLDVVVWDRRGTGRSGGMWDYGASDQSDLMTIVRAVDSRTLGHDIGLFGIGSGAAASLVVASQTAMVQAVAVYGVGIHGAASPWNAFTDPRAFPGRLLMRLQGVRAGPYQAPEQTTALDDAVRKLRRRAVFVSVGGRDARVTKAEALELYRAAFPPKEWGYAPNAGGAPPTFMMASQVVDFFVRRLR